MLAATSWSAREKDGGVRGLSPRQGVRSLRHPVLSLLSLHDPLSKHIHDDERVEEMRSGHDEELSGKFELHNFELHDVQT